MEDFKNMTQIEEVEAFIHGSGVHVIYISKQNCSVCQSLFPKIKDMFKKYKHVLTGYVTIDALPQLAETLDVFTAPLFILFIDGKEYIRQSRHGSLLSFEEKADQLIRDYGQM